MHKSSILRNPNKDWTTFRYSSWAFRPNRAYILIYSDRILLFSYRNFRIVGMFLRIWGCESSWKKLSTNFIVSIHVQIVYIWYGLRWLCFIFYESILNPLILLSMVVDYDSFSSTISKAYSIGIYFFTPWAFWPFFGSGMFPSIRKRS